MTVTVNFSEEREALLAYLERQLIGPANGEREELPISSRPDERYLMAVLFPPGAGQGNKESAYDPDESAADDPVSMAYQQLPASIGLSFFTRADSVIISICAAVYEKYQEGSYSCWKRRSIATLDKPEKHVLSCKSTSADQVLEGNGRLCSIWRKKEEGWLVTVTLINANAVDKKGRFDPQHVLYQTWLRCEPVGEAILAYPSPDRYSWDTEEEELALIYDSKRTYAIGHGTSAYWNTEAEVVTGAESAFLPRYEVPPITADFSQGSPMASSEAFSLQYLADSEVKFEDKCEKLQAFIDHYGDWIGNQVQLAAKIGKFPKAAERILARLEQAKERMQKGLDFMASNIRARQCFEMANLAMLMQMAHSHDNYAGTTRGKGHGNGKPDYTSEDWRRCRWRPFQLAFQLLVIESLANRNSTDRDTVDLIWFPTGGGKTEAYLAVAAFELFWRRLSFGDKGGGTAIIKRYTLRLLTSQQFQRVSTLICACEKIRRSNSEDLGDEPFTLGLWVGGDTSPNDFQKAYLQFQTLLNDLSPVNPFQLLQCPWCGCRIVPEKQEVAAHYGVRCDDSFFEFHCPDEQCDFHDALPINVVDQHLYQYPPSFLVGTVDKFARLAWLDEPRAFFCGGQQGERHPPSLIIQDELHLISGPLGTIAGLYEAAMDVVMASAGARPKYIAATATIRRAPEQAKRLYARDVAVFPPAGIDVKDAYFSREETGSPGRMYAGLLSPHQSPVFSLAGTAAALAQAPMDVPLSDDAKDAYWTQVIFHNSRRELGKTMTLSRDDIPKRVAVLAKSEEHARTSTDPVEMSANIPSREIPMVLKQLGHRWNSGEAVDVLPCTNMLSVGVDVPRLGLIMMNGQPKTTAEYIQASSRVGRGKVPGLVLTFYPNNKARDRSHYEGFLPYHQALYRAVEPTSVTPFAQPAMERALHAALVIVMRYCGGCSGNSGAQRFNKNDPQVIKFSEMLLRRMLAASDGSDREKKLINGYMTSCIDMWHERASAAGGSMKDLRYEGGMKAKNFDPLLVSYAAHTCGKPTIPWTTLNAMRSIDGECSVHVRGENQNGK